LGEVVPSQGSEGRRAVVRLSTSATSKHALWPLAVPVRARGGPCSEGLEKHQYNRIATVDQGLWRCTMPPGTIVFYFIGCCFIATRASGIRGGALLKCNELYYKVENILNIVVKDR
jgi:hypothetical protein